LNRFKDKRATSLNRSKPEIVLKEADMATLNIALRIPGERVRYDFIGALQAAWQAYAERRRERRMLIEISRLAPHVIRDMGLEPELVYEALDGSWDEVDPSSWRGLLPRRARI
jgi:uncharacterized protein YjiS (DUF1127 family)